MRRRRSRDGGGTARQHDTSVSGRENRGVAYLHPAADPGFVGDDGPHPDHATPAEVVAERLGSDPARGLSADDAATRLGEHGPNELDRGEG